MNRERHLSNLREEGGGAGASLPKVCLAPTPPKFDLAHPKETCGLQGKVWLNHTDKLC